MTLGGMFARSFRRNAERRLRSHLPPRGITDISWAREPSGARVAIHPSPTLKRSHVRRRESLSAFCSSRTALRQVLSSSKKTHKSRSWGVTLGSFIGIPVAMSAYAITIGYLREQRKVAILNCQGEGS